MAQDERNERVDRHHAENSTALEPHGDDVDAALQARERRRAAEREDLPDSTDRATAGGFGSGQGMGAERTGQGPQGGAERGEPRTAADAEDWPV